MDLLNLIRKSREKLQPHWVFASLACVIYGLLVGVPSELNVFGELLSFLLAGPLQLGMCIYFLNILYDRPATIGNLAEGFKPLVKVLLFYLIISVATIIGLILLIIPGFIIALGFSMTFYLIAENPELSVEDALKESWALTDGYKWELFELHLRFTPWYILGVICLVVGIFFVMPWHYLTVANYYDYLKRQQHKTQEG